MGETERERIGADRRAVRDAFGADLWDEVSNILFEHDPIGINFGRNTDEYEPEVQTILPRLVACATPEEAQRVIFEEFEKWFGVGHAGPIERYDRLARRVWDVWTEHHGSP
ncbi:MAG: hypothetical protein H6734_01420 [Alphaproteobacteria bacterium]|nr:hypothetical protein [Alphaproteobacteria bacterium]